MGGTPGTEKHTLTVWFIPLWRPVSQPSTSWPSSSGSSAWTFAPPCLQNGQVLASAVSRLVSAAAACFLTHTLSSTTPPADRCSHTTQLALWSPGCFDFKYLPRRDLPCLAMAGGAAWLGVAAGKSTDQSVQPWDLWYAMKTWSFAKVWSCNKLRTKVNRVHSVIIKA